MMMKIFGVLLIVSGGILMGWIPANQNKKRKEKLNLIKEILESFLVELKERRIPMREFLSDNPRYEGVLNKPEEIRFLLKEDVEMLNNTFEKLKISPHQQSVSLCEKQINELSLIIQGLSDYEKKTGKALPMVTGTIGLLLAVLLI